MTKHKIYIFSPDFKKSYIVAGDMFTSVVVEAQSEKEAWRLLKSHPNYWDEDGCDWQVKTADELLTGKSRVILLTYGMY